MRLFPIILAGASLLITQCDNSSSRRNHSQSVNITVTQDAADGLDLQAVTALLKTVKTPEELEQKINSTSPRINNLDLNEDGSVDYVNVTEYGDEQVKGFSLTTELAKDDVQELATIEIRKDNEGNIQVQSQGNTQIYGHNHYYHSRFGLGDYLLMSYIFSPHRYYASSWGYGHYPSYYNNNRRPVSRDQYRSGLQSINRKNITSSRTQNFKSSIKSPNVGKTSNRIKAPLRNPTTSQKAFQKKNPSRTVRSGGFGKKSTSNSKKHKFSGSLRSSPRSGSRFGGGK